MTTSPAGHPVSACSNLTARAHSGAQEIESFLARRVDAPELQQLRSLASKLQHLSITAGDLEKKLREAQPATPGLHGTLSTEVTKCNDTAAIVIKQLMRLGPNTPRDTISPATVLLFESFAEAVTRFLAFSTQLLAIDSVKVQESRLQSQDASIILRAVTSACRDVAGSSGILLDTEAISQNSAKKGGDTSDADPPGYAVYQDPPPAFGEDSSFAQARSALLRSDAGGRGSSSSSSRNKDSDRGFLSSLANPFKAVTAALRPKSEPLVSVLCQAAAAGKMSQIHSLLAEGANIDGRNEDGQTALICAIRAGQLHSVQTLLDSGADISRTDSGRSGRPPLFHAVDVQSRPAAEFLLRRGADVNQKDEWAGQPLFSALVTGDTAPEWIALLLSYGADAMAVDDSGQALVILAIKRRKRAEDREEVVRLLVKHGAGVDTRDTDGTPLVQICLQQKRRGLVLELLSLGADPNAKDVSGISLLEVAIKSNDLELARAVLEKGADPNANDFHGLHLLFSVPKENKSPAAADKDAFAVLLLEHGARGGEKDFYGVTALEHALSSIIQGISAAASGGDEFRVPELLLKQGADANQRLTKVPGEPRILAYAVDRGLWDLAALVLRYRAAVNVVDAQGRTALVQAVRRGDVDAVAMLLRHGANVNQPGPGLPLDVAVVVGNGEVVELLKEHGAVGK